MGIYSFFSKKTAQLIKLTFSWSDNSDALPNGAYSGDEEGQGKGPGTGNY
jgi:hypothetical protein